METLKLTMEEHNKNLINKIGSIYHANHYRTCTKFTSKQTTSQQQRHKIILGI